MPQHRSGRSVGRPQGHPCPLAQRHQRRGRAAAEHGPDAGGEQHRVRRGRRQRRPAATPPRPRPGSYSGTLSAPATPTSRARDPHGQAVGQRVGRRQRQRPGARRRAPVAGRRGPGPLGDRALGLGRAAGAPARRCRCGPGRRWRTCRRRRRSARRRSRSPRPARPPARRRPGRAPPSPRGAARSAAAASVVSDRDGQTGSQKPHSTQRSTSSSTSGTTLRSLIQAAVVVGQHRRRG